MMRIRSTSINIQGPICIYECREALQNVFLDSNLQSTKKDQLHTFITLKFNGLHMQTCYSIVNELSLLAILAVL